MSYSIRGLPILVPLLATGALSAQFTTRETVDERGLQTSAPGNVFGCSADGRFVLVTLVGDVTPSAPPANTPWGDLYLRDRSSGVLELISIGCFGDRADESTFEAAMTPDLRFVAFSSHASNLVQSDANSFCDVFVRYRAAGATVLVSATPSGMAGDGYSFTPSISSDGRWVAFESDADDLVPGDANQAEDVFVHDLWNSTTRLVSVGLDGLPGNMASRMPSISRDGSSILFASSATDLVPGSTNGFRQIYLRALATETTELVSSGASGAIADGDCSWPAPSADARSVAFVSAAKNVVPFDLDARCDCFVRDRLLATTELISLPSAADPAEWVSDVPAITPDGRFVAFTSDTGAVDPHDLNSNADAFVRDRASGAIDCVSRRPNGATGQGPSVATAITDDGRWVSFWSNSAIFVLGDSNGTSDGFVRDLVAPSGSVLATYCTAKPNSAGCTPRISASGKASLSDPLCLLITAGNVLTQKNGLLVWGFAQAALPFHGGTLCVAAPHVRTPMQSSGGVSSAGPCAGTFSMRFDAPFFADHGVGAGTTLYAQYYYRDPGFAEPDNVGLSDGLQLTVWP